ncbi:MAG TPA: TrpB-like pyridoxal phosphate-dependent enzyme [bacterium]
MGKKIMLNSNDIPKEWYNIIPDLPAPLDPPLDPGTKQPIAPEKLAAIFPMGLLEQEMSPERWIKIPEEILEIYSTWRPTPLYRAEKWENFLGTPAHIYYKYEGNSPPGSHKPNTSVAQAYYNKKAGIKRLATETGAGQWGSALAFATSLFGMECTVYMVKISFEQKPYRRILMETWGANVIPSPSNTTEAGRKIRGNDPDCTGSLGIAISEAIEDAVSKKSTNYALGSVLNHVLLHQTVIGLEAKKQMEIAGEYPDIIYGCIGGGSNFAGIAFPFLMDKLQGKKPKLRAVAVEPSACPTLTKGEYRYDFGDTAGMTPLLKMYTLGNAFIPPPIHAGGLRYHGDAPLVCLLYNKKAIEAEAFAQTPVFKSAIDFSRIEGIIPAPEAAHAIKAVEEEALRCKKNKEKKVILFNLSGHGYFDLQAYSDFLGGKLIDV